METLKMLFLNKRVQSFLWRTGMMLLAVVVSQVTSALPLLADYTNPVTITVLGLVLGEVSKAINNAVQGK
jgi:hypothetical protein